jgi:hypothetical protein
MIDSKVILFAGQKEATKDDIEMTPLQEVVWYLAEVEVIIGGIKVYDANSNALKDIAMERTGMAYEIACDMLKEAKQEHPNLHSHLAPGGLQ